MNGHSPALEFTGQNALRDQVGEWVLPATTGHSLADPLDHEDGLQHRVSEWVLPLMNGPTLKMRHRDP
jgi:hypothetical protein